MATWCHCRARSRRCCVKMPMDVWWRRSSAATTPPVIPGRPRRCRWKSARILTAVCRPRQPFIARTSTDTCNGTKEEVVTYRKDQNGRFDEALKQVTDTVVANGQSTSSTAQYELGADTGKLQLASQTVTHVRKN